LHTEFKEFFTNNNTFCPISDFSLVLDTSNTPLSLHPIIDLSEFISMDASGDLEDSVIKITTNIESD
jgi:hypothetical protein